MTYKTQPYMVGITLALVTYCGLASAHGIYLFGVFGAVVAVPGQLRRDLPDEKRHRHNGHEHVPAARMVEVLPAGHYSRSKRASGIPRIPAQ